MRLTEARGFAPTVRELASDLGIRSTAGITDHLRLLALKGAVTWVPMCSRTLRVLVPGDLL